MSGNIRDNDINFEKFSVNKDTQYMIKLACWENIDTVWDRLAAQEPQCGYCSLGLSCRICAMGPCRIDPWGDGPQRGVCGADADTIVARNFARMIAAGACSHSDHGRDILEVFEHVSAGETTSYKIKDEDKLKRLAYEWGVNVSNDRKTNDIARELASEMMEEYGMRKKYLTFTRRAPEKRRDVWEKAGITPRGIYRENVEMFHRTHMGVDNDYINILLHSLRTSLSDGWGGSMIATELSDVIFGTPQPVQSLMNLGVLKSDQVNIILHGHNPLLSDVIVRAAQNQNLLKLANIKGAKGINMAGLCCTGNELLMRRGVPIAGNHLMQELAIITGAVDMMIVDYQCIMPSITEVARCFHTKVVSTFDKAKFPGATHVSFDPKRGMETGEEIVRMAIENYPNRSPERMFIPDEPVSMMGGFSVEAILSALGGTPRPLVDAIIKGRIRGVAGIVGCNNPKIKQDYGHVTLAKRLIENDILVLVTGCASIANGKAGQMIPESANMAGLGLREICKTLGIPPVLHMGSCVDNTRILVIAAALADYLGVDIGALPLAVAAPEWYSEKAVAIGAYMVASGIYTVLGVRPPVFGSSNVVNLLTSGLESVVGATFSVEPDPEKAAVMIRRHIEKKRSRLRLPFFKPDSIQ